MSKSFLFLLLISWFTITSNISLAQKNKLKIKESLQCPEIICKDTAGYHYEDSLGKKIDFIYPYNTKISFSINGGNDELKTISAGARKDTTIIYITKQSYGLIIDVIIKIANKHIFSEIKYWEIPEQSSTRFEIINSEVVLDKEKYVMGDWLMGTIKISFKGQMFDFPEGDQIKIRGNINGCFKVKIDQVLRSRLR